MLPNIEVWTDAWLLMPGSGRCSRGGWWFWTTADSFGSRDAKLAWSKVTAWHEGTKKHMCFLQTSGWSTVLVVHITYVRHKPTVFTYAIHGWYGMIPAKRKPADGVLPTAGPWAYDLTKKPKKFWCQRSIDKLGGSFNPGEVEQY